MPRIYVALFVFAISIHSLRAQYSGLTFSAGYVQSRHDALDDYFSVLSDSMHLDEAFILKGGVDFGMGFMKHSEQAEFQCSGYITRVASYRGSDFSNSGICIVKDISLLFGGNYLPTEWFLLGASLAVNASEASTEIVSANAYPAPMMESLPATDFNIFRGYTVGARAQAGFVFPFQEIENSSLRILYFYQYGVTKFDFMSVTEPHLAHYNGESKSHADIMGINLEFIFGWN